MRHVRQKLGFVFRAESELFRFVFERERAPARSGGSSAQPRSFVRQKPRLVLEFLVGLLQFFLLLFEKIFGRLQRLGLQLEPPVRFLKLGLAELQFLGERLRLFEQFLGSHVRFDRVDDDTDRFGKLVEEAEAEFR